MAARVEMHFADGTVISAWESFRLFESFTDPLSDFSFVCRPPREQIGDYRKRLQKGELVTILVNDANQGTFLIVERRLTVARDSGVTITARCKTVLCTVYEASVDPKLSLSSTTDVSISDAILKALGPYGFDVVIGDSAASANAITGQPIGGRRAAITVDALKHQEAQAQDGETAYEFCKRIVTRLGVILRVAVDGTLMVTAPDYDQEASYTIVQTFGLDAPRGDVATSLEVTDTNEGQFSECVVRGTAAFKPGSTETNEPRACVAPLSPLPAGATAAEIDAVGAAVTAARAQTSSAALPVSYYDDGTRPLYTSTVAAYKPKIVKDKNSRDSARALSTAKLALTKGALSAYTVTVEVPSLVSQTGRVWAVDTIARIYSDAEGLDEEMWVLSRELMQTRQDGQSTKLTMIPKGALVLGDIPG